MEKIIKTILSKLTTEQLEEIQEEIKQNKEIDLNDLINFNKLINKK